MERSLLFCVFAGTLACPPQSGLVKNDTMPWSLHETIEEGACDFRLEDASVRHETSWRADLEVTSLNASTEPTHCSFDFALVDPNGKVMSPRAKAGGNLGAGSDRNDLVGVEQRFTAEAPTHTDHGPWVHVRVHEGFFPGPGTSYRIVP